MVKFSGSFDKYIAVKQVFLRKMLGTRYGPVGTRFSLILGT